MLTRGFTLVTLSLWVFCLAPQREARGVPLTGEDNEAHTVKLDGSFKSFFYLMHFPQYPADLLTLMGLREGRGGMALADLRLKLEGEHHERWRWGVHLRTQPQVSSFASARSALSLAGGARPARSLPLQGMAPQDDTLSWAHEVDRLFFQVRLGMATLIVGRQPVSLGVGFVWMPADLVGTFSPVELDQEYKPGVDALRVNLALGRFTELSLVAAAGGPSCLRRFVVGTGTRQQLPNGDPCHQYSPQFTVHHSVLMTRLRTTVGAWDLGVLTGWVRGDVVAGAFATGTLGRFRLRGEVVYTWDVEEDLPDVAGLVYAGIGNSAQRSAHFARAVLGADYTFDTKRHLSVMAEVYYNGFGRLHARDYVALAARPRVAEYGEVFNLGVFYAALGLAWEPHDRVDVSLALLGNLLDPSLLVNASVTWKVSDEVVFVAGALTPAGRGPRLDLSGPYPMRARSELGLFPYLYYLQWKLYF